MEDLNKPSTSTFQLDSIAAHTFWFMTYEETLAYIFAKLPMFSRVGASAYREDLTNTKTLCAHLGNPEIKFKSIHVAGTNGKGSVSHMLAAVLQANGYTTGLYTSPHLYDFRERIKINGAMVDKNFVVDFIEQLRPLIESLKPSFFEITVALAFHLFAEKKVDVAIIEVGLGGRLDSTNVIVPLASVITNIGWDHMNILGDTLEKIATEKAGVIKDSIPVIIGERDSDTAAVFAATAGNRNAPVYFASDRFAAKHYRWEKDLLHVQVADSVQNKSIHYKLDLPGIYQVKNICTLLQTLAVIGNDFVLNEAKTQDALTMVKATTGLSGRWEVISDAPKIVLDVAHNPSGISELVKQLDHEAYQKLHIVLGMVKDKEAAAVLSLLPTAATYYFTQAHIPRALPASELAAAANQHQLKGAIYPHVAAALMAARESAASKDLILVCGSIFLVAEVEREAFNN